MEQTPTEHFSQHIVCKYQEQKRNTGILYTFISDPYIPISYIADEANIRKNNKTKISFIVIQKVSWLVKYGKRR